MVKKFLKSKSKRMPAKKRYKIERKVREHNRKIRKDEKVKARGKSGKHKLITVPGDCPFKGQILTEAIALRENIKQTKLKRREEVKAIRKEKRSNLVAEKRGLSEPSLTKTGVVKLNTLSTAVTKPMGTSFDDLRKKAEERGYFFEKVEQQKGQRDSSLKAFYREFQQVIGDSDVIIQVLDSRDPLGTRSTEAEEAVRSHSDKKLIMILNKCDLIPVENLQKWITYLNQTEGCVVLPFKANTQKQKDRFGSIGIVNVNSQASMETKKSIGVSDLMGLLGTWARGSAGGLTVGVIGMPNVGKSSLINSLKRSKACNIGAKPGVTRACQVVHLDSKLRLIDSPGVCFSKEKGSDAMTVDIILSRVPKTTLMLQYGISEFRDTEEFLALIATKFGQIKKGGVPNPEAAEQKIIHDWHTGSIRFFTEPPELSSTTTATAFVSTLSAPFSISNFMGSEQVMDAEENEDDDDIEMEPSSEDEEDEKPAVRVTRSAAKKSVSFAIDTDMPSKERRKLEKGGKKTPEKPKLHGLVATKKAFMKKIRKTKKKSAKQANELANLVDDISL